MEGGWQPTQRTDDSSYGETMTSYNNSYSGPKGNNFTSRPPRREEFKVYIKNVPLDMTKESLEALFTNCGTVVSVHILAPKEGRNSTIGFVGFAAEEEVGIAIEKMNGTTLGDNHLVVEKAMPRERGGTPRRDQESQFQRRGDFQNSAGGQNDRPSFQGSRTQNEQPQRDGYMGQQNYNQQAVNGPTMMNNQGGMGIRHEEPVFNPRGPGRGGNPNEQSSFQGYRSQNFNSQPQWSGNRGQQTYTQQAVNRPEGGMGVRREEAVYNPRGPGRGGGIQTEQRSFQGYQQNYNEQPMEGGNYGQHSYSQPAVNGPEMTTYQHGMGIRHEEATFNPRGPGRGGGVIDQPPPDQAPGGGHNYMNGMANDYSNVEGQGNSTSWLNEGQQQWGNTRHDAVDLQQQDMSITGRLPHSVSSQDSYSKPQQNGGQSCYKCGETGHFARECPNQENRGGRGWINY